MVKKSQTESRKKEHVDIVLQSGMQYSRTTGLERVEFVHNALPEIDIDNIDLSVHFLGKSISYPIIIEAMTGGYKEAEKINRDLATIAQEHSIGFALGSQRAMLENASLKKTYYVRDVAPEIPIIANIGAVQLKKYPIEKILGLVSSVEADALAIHLNPLQEAIQPEGDRDFSGVLNSIEKLRENSHVPIIIKETGAGISQEVALKLKLNGASFIDVAGAGGTSWAKVEYARKGLTPGFEEWGMDTMNSLIQCRGVLPMIASGGIRNGIDAAKTIALGAELAGAAYPFLKALSEKRLSEELTIWENQLRIVAFLTGCKHLDELKRAKMVFH